MLLCVDIPMEVNFTLQSGAATPVRRLRASVSPSLRHRLVFLHYWKNVLNGSPKPRDSKKDPHRLYGYKAQSLRGQKLSDTYLYYRYIYLIQPSLLKWTSTFSNLLNVQLKLQRKGSCLTSPKRNKATGTVGRKYPVLPRGERSLNSVIPKAQRPTGTIWGADQDLVDFCFIRPNIA